MKEGNKKKKNAKEIENDMLDNKDKYIGTSITTEGGIKCLVTGIGEDGIRSLPIDVLANMKRRDL